jgi:hypothetical protein
MVKGLMDLMQGSPQTPRSSGRGDLDRDRIKGDSPGPRRYLGQGNGQVCESSSAMRPSSTTGFAQV